MENIKKIIYTYDIIFIHETHCSSEMVINMQNFYGVQHPCSYASPIHPRGGCIMFIKDHLIKYIEGVDTTFNDIITVYMYNNVVFCGCYIPPDDSKYYNDHFVNLEIIAINTIEKEGNLIICGDLNSRIGSISQLNGLRYKSNPDKVINKHGQRLLEICKDHNLLLLNHLQTKSNSFPGDFTFHRNNLKSQNDWFIVSKNFLDNVISFSLKREYNTISDHIPIAAEFILNNNITINQLLKSINDISTESNNHSQVKSINMKNIEKDSFKNVIASYINEIHDIHKVISIDNLISNIDNAFHKAAKMTSRHTVPNAKTTNNQERLQIVNDDDTNSIIKHYNTLEHESWKNLIHINNTKQIWEKIDFNGKCKEHKTTSDTSCNEFAEYLENRCSLPYQHTDYNDLKTDVFNPTLDSKITEKEIIDATRSMNNGSKAKCGIPLPLFSMVFKGIYIKISKIMVAFHILSVKKRQIKHTICKRYFDQTITRKTV